MTIRIEKSKLKINQLFGKELMGVAATDPEFQDIMDGFVFSDVYGQDILDNKLRELITLVVLTANQNLTRIRYQVAAALNGGLTPIEIKEAIYQCAPYIGFPKTLDALNEVNQAFLANHIPLHLESQQTVNEDTRLIKGIEVQTEIFGDIITKMRENPTKGQEHIQD